MKITNINREGGPSVDFTLSPKTRGGEVSVESLRPGETKNVEISSDDPQVLALLHTRQITTGESNRAAVPTPPKKEVSGA